MITGTVTAEGLIDLLVTELTGATDAGSDVQAYRDWGINTNPGPFTPKITVDLPVEEKESIGDAGAASFNTTATITLHGYVSAVASADPGGDGGEVRARQAALQLRRQIEVAVINNPDLMGSISEIVGVRSEFEAAPEQNGLHIIEVAIAFKLRFYQGAEDFAQLDLGELDTLHLDVKPRDPAGFDLAIDIPVT